ncbi:hypothetical protein [Paenibacillus aestuarii]|uniref:LXG domain-containing protein n=1 Tax=Paenibacillus aestuarii TaxID=516965 RepID=A0ABW0KEX5_9BACL|nr:hypothetical protein [Paenibacillus aestuarii]
MINAYPITAITSYQTHKDYYRINAIRSITGGKTSTSRQPFTQSYEQSAYKQYAQQAAQQLADLTQSAQKVKQSAYSLAQSSSGALSGSMHNYVQAFNQLKTQLRSASASFNSSALDQIEQSASPSPLNDAGIDQLEDGTFELKNPDQVQASTPGWTRLVQSIKDNMGQIDQAPSEALLQLNQSPLSPYRKYRLPLQAYLPVPLHGLLLDRRM